jgi:murein DD-endopeptidase MepM/ murein hydrolase activator NlpD
VTAPVAARALAALLALLGALAAGRPAGAAEPGAPPPADAADRLFEQLRGRVEAQRERFHWSARSIDRNLLLEEVAKRIEAGDSEPEIAAWLDEELPRRLLGFAPIDPEVGAQPSYALPFDRRVHWIVSQGMSSDSSHRGFDEFALDFAMPEGTEVWAARGGSVARVVDGFRECAVSKRRAWASNSVVVLHEDGSFARYDHLSPGIAVAEGQTVAVGDRLGRSGCTGHAATPHLHFQVSARRSATRVHSIALRFGDASEAGYVPRVWSLYQSRPPATAPLRVSIAGRELASGQPFAVADARSLQLRVEALAPTGGERDVTHDPGTRYVALTPWSLAVDTGGNVRWGARSKAWAPLPDDLERGFAIATILYRDAAGREGYFDAWLTLPAPAPGAGAAR